MVAKAKAAKSFGALTEKKLHQVVDWSIERNLDTSKRYVEKLREQHPAKSPDELALMIVQRRSIKNGFLGAATSVGGVLTLPAGIAADVGGSFYIQVATAVAVAEVYGHTKDTLNLKTDVMLILAGEAASQALKRAGIEVGKAVSRKAIDKVITRAVMKKINAVIPRHLITKAGTKSATSFMRLVPLVGAPIGFGVDYAYARVVGRQAIRYYGGAA